MEIENTQVKVTMDMADLKEVVLQYLKANGVDTNGEITIKENLRREEDFDGVLGSIYRYGLKGLNITIEK